jgi:hypothetical protein
VDTPTDERSTAPRYLACKWLPSDYDTVTANFWTLSEALALAKLDLKFAVGTAAECTGLTVAYTCGVDRICFCRDVFFKKSTEDHRSGSQQATVLHEVSHLGDVLDTEDEPPELKQAYAYQRFAANEPYLPMTPKPVVEQIVRRFDVPAKSPNEKDKNRFTVSCGEGGLPTSGGWENVVGNMGVYHSRMNGSTDWEVRVWNQESTAKTVGIRASCLYNVKTAQVAVAEVKREARLTKESPLYDQQLDCTSSSGGGIPIGGGFSLWAAGNEYPALNVALVQAGGSPPAATFRLTDDNPAYVVTQTATCLKNLTGATISVRTATYDSSSGRAHVPCNDNEVMTWAGFKMADSSATVVPQAVGSRLTRSDRATGYTGALVPAIPGGADPSKIQAVATCVGFP